MRVKTVPEDFQVEELLALSPGPQGPFAVFRVEKRNVTTLAVQEGLAARWGVPPKAFQFPALKDKVALSVQYCTVRAGKKVPPSVRGPGFFASLVGFLTKPLTPGDLKGNRFTVTLRDLGEEEAQRLWGKFEVVANEGFPNYFDLQRFGSWNAKLGFPGKFLLLGRWEEALRAYLAEPLAGDPPLVRRFKKLARENWGNWRKLKEEAPRGNLRSVLTFLCDHPQDHKRAVNLITPRVLSLWLSAYQSFLWNRAVSRVLQEVAGEEGSGGSLRFPWGGLFLPAYPLCSGVQCLGGLSLPLPSRKAFSFPHRGEGWGEGDVGERLRQVLLQVLSEEGLTVQDLRARGLRRAYLAGTSRALWVVPGEPKMSKPAADELFPGRWKVTASFVLPPGAYATLFLRILELALQALFLTEVEQGRKGPGEGEGGAQGGEGRGKEEGPFPVGEGGDGKGQGCAETGSQEAL